MLSRATSVDPEMQPTLLENIVAVSCSDSICNMELEMLWPEKTVGETRHLEVIANRKSCFGALV